MKTGRNESCPCGSGLKYKKCCLNKTEMERHAEALIDINRTIGRDARIKRCMHPNKEECSDNIIKAHAIQNNRILKKLSVMGCVMTMDGTSNLIFQGVDNKGRKIATTFTGFCSYHDKVLFQAIEDYEFEGSKKQVFLWTYRTMAWHYHKKQEQKNAIKIIKNKMSQKGLALPKNIQHDNLMKGFELGERDNQIEKECFDKDLLGENYDNISYVIWEIPYELQFAISMMHELEHDISGRLINDLASNAATKKIYLNIFPAMGESYCIWSWHKKNDNVYMPFTKQFMQLRLEDKENYLNNNMPIWSDAIIISPNLWNKWGEDIQQALISHANMDELYRMFANENNDHTYQYMDTPWNFFEKLSIV